MSSRRHAHASAPLSQPPTAGAAFHPPPVQPMSAAAFQTPQPQPPTSQPPQQQPQIAVRRSEARAPPSAPPPPATSRKRTDRERASAPSGVSAARPARKKRRAGAPPAAGTSVATEALRAASAPPSAWTTAAARFASARARASDAERGLRDEAAEARREKEEALQRLQGCAPGTRAVLRGLNPQVVALLLSANGRARKDAAAAPPPLAAADVEAVLSLRTSHTSISEGALRVAAERAVQLRSVDAVAPWSTVLDHAVRDACTLRTPHVAFRPADAGASVAGGSPVDIHAIEQYASAVVRSVQVRDARATTVAPLRAEAKEMREALVRGAPREAVEGGAVAEVAVDVSASSSYRVVVEGARAVAAEAAAAPPSRPGRKRTTLPFREAPTLAETAARALGDPARSASVDELHARLLEAFRTALAAPRPPRERAAAAGPRVRLKRIK